MRKPAFAYAKTKVQINCAVTAEADQHFCFCYIDSTIPLLHLCFRYIDSTIPELPKSNISSI